MIQVVGSKLSQWDVGRSVSVSDSNATHVHFANQGDSKAVIIEIAEGSAKIPDYLLQTGKVLLAYAVIDGVTLESKSFAVRKRERPENYVYEDDQRNYIYELITGAEMAVEDANQAADSATLAAQGANTSAGRANAASENANKAAVSATEAAKNANEAAAKAAHTAKSLMVVGQASGANIHLDDAIDQFLVGMRIFGKTTQDGTPTPDAPADLVSAGDGGSITVNVAGENEVNSMTILTPNGLPGIPVTSSSNYTDANGQQWICDEIDLTRGVHIQRIATIDLSTLTTWARGTGNGWANASAFYSTNAVPEAASIEGYDTKANILCNRLIVATPGNIAGKTVNSIGQGTGNSIYVSIEGVEAAADLITYFAENETVAQYVLAEPIETDLTEAEIAAFAALHTNKPNTTIYNDDGAWMELEYVMDAKKYIDRLVGSGGSGGSSARLSQVTLRASAWTGSDSLYSQVVAIDGVTEYSKVDLLPSVEQLAIFHNKDVAFVTENEDGVVTVYAIGDKPTNDYTMQVSITEVFV